MKKTIGILSLFFAITVFASPAQRITGTAKYYCGDNEAIKINMSSVNEVMLECRKFAGPVGSACAMDSECSSSCCDTSSKTCLIHDPATGQFCSKPVGQSCKDSSYCMIHPVTNCYIINEGRDALGNKLCALRCFTKEVRGTCNKDKVCTPPREPQRPVFNPNDPNRCDGAIDFEDIPKLK